MRVRCKHSLIFCFLLTCVIFYLKLKESRTEGKGVKDTSKILKTGVHYSPSKENEGYFHQPYEEGSIFEILADKLRIGKQHLDGTIPISDADTVEDDSDEIDSLEAIFQERRNRIADACSRNSFHPQKPDREVRLRTIIDSRQHLAYCPVPKSASTFWRRVFQIVTGRSKAKSPFDPSVSVGLHKNTEKATSLPRTSLQSFMEKSLTFLFVRDPYSRLLSSYVDKLFSPNAHYWKIYGAFGVSTARKNPNKMDLVCGHDLTFKEFVKTVIYAEKNGIQRNGHFTPQYDSCDPCQYRYGVIGKLETLQQDTFYLLDKMGKPDLRKSLEKDFSQQTINDTIRDQVLMLFYFRTQCEDCGVSFFEAQKLMWKKFQIRGVLSKKSRYPVTDEMSKTISQEEFTRVLFKGIGDAANKAIAKRNKEEATLEAFSTVDKDDMETLSELFKPDCELFGYNCRPDELFNIRKSIQPWYFDSSTA